MSVRARIVIQIESRMRTRVLAPLCASLLMLAGCSGSRQELNTEYQADLAVEGEAAAVVTRPLPAGNYLVELREHDIALRLVVDAPGTHVESADTVPRHGVLHAVVRLGAAGNLTVTARSADHATKRGAAQLRIARWLRDAGAPAGELENGYAALASAGELTARKTP